MPKLVHEDISLFILGYYFITLCFILRFFCSVVNSVHYFVKKASIYVCTYVRTKYTSKRTFVVKQYQYHWSGKRIRDLDSVAT